MRHQQVRGSYNYDIVINNNNILDSVWFGGDCWRGLHRSILGFGKISSTTFPYYRFGWLRSTTTRSLSLNPWASKTWASELNYKCTTSISLYCIIFSCPTLLQFHYIPIGVIQNYTVLYCLNVFCFSFLISSILSHSMDYFIDSQVHLKCSVWIFCCCASELLILSLCLSLFLYPALIAPWEIHSHICW